MHLHVRAHIFAGCMLLSLALINPNSADAATASAVSVSPASGAGVGPQVFLATYADSGYMGTMYLSFGSSTPVPNGCTMGYVWLPSQTGFFLYDDSGVGMLSLSSAASVSNSQCRLTKGGSVTASGIDLTVPFSVTFLNGFSAQKTIYAWASDAFTGPGAVKNVGTWYTGQLSGEPQVMDSAGHSFGVLESLSFNSSTVFILFQTPDGVIIPGIFLSPTSVVDYFSAFFYFTSSNCSTTPYLPSGTWPTIANGYQVVSGVLSYPQPNTQQMITANSYSFESSCTPIPSTPLAVSSVETLNLSTYMVPPFTIKLQ